jgi:DNA-binding CsgD family transcriptional regulator
MPLYLAGIHPANVISLFIEILLLFYLILYRLGREKAKVVSLDIQLLLLLVVYNLCSGMSFPLEQTSANYITSSICPVIEFITPCFFPYYTVKAFNIKGIWLRKQVSKVLFFVLPYSFLLVIFIASGALYLGQHLIILPSVYAFWSLYCLSELPNHNSKIDRLLLLFCLLCWMLLPVAQYLQSHPAVEVLLTNSGFLTLFCIHVQRTIRISRTSFRRLALLEHQVRSLQSELLEKIALLSDLHPTKTSLECFTACCETFLLSKREREIAWLAVDGITHKEIGLRLFISERTVSKHIEHIFEKVGACTRAEMTRKLLKPAAIPINTSHYV